MIKLSILFRKPADTNAFEEKFARHVQLITAMANVQRAAVSRSVGSPRGEAPYYLIHEIYFADMPAATYALNSPEGRTAGGDLLVWARDISTLMFSEVWGEDMVTRDEMNKQIDATRREALLDMDKKLEAAREEGRAEVRKRWDASLPSVDSVVAAVAAANAPANAPAGTPAQEPLKPAEGFDMSFSQFAPPKKDAPVEEQAADSATDNTPAAAPIPEPESTTSAATQPKAPYTIDDILAIAKGEKSVDSPSGQSG